MPSETKAGSVSGGVMNVNIDKRSVIDLMVTRSRMNRWPLGSYRNSLI